MLDWTEADLAPLVADQHVFAPPAPTDGALPLLDRTIAGGGRRRRPDGSRRGVGWPAAAVVRVELDRDGVPEVVPIEAIAESDGRASTARRGRRRPRPTGPGRRGSRRRSRISRWSPWWPADDRGPRRLRGGRWAVLVSARASCRCPAASRRRRDAAGRRRRRRGDGEAAGRRRSTRGRRARSSSPTARRSGVGDGSARCGGTVARVRSPGLRRDRDARRQAAVIREVAPRRPRWGRWGRGSGRPATRFATSPTRGRCSTRRELRRRS